VLPSCVVPEIVGGAVFFGAVPVGLTTSVGREAATPEPLLFVAVTCTRTRCPTSAVCRVYCWLVAPAIAPQFPPWSSQRSHW